MAPQIDADVLVVSKPRLPSLQLGIAAKALRNRPLILDIDDYEMGFFSSRGKATSSTPGNEDYLSPYGEYWTQYCESLIEGADAITVASTELQAKYGGTLVPHMRDETLFDPELLIEVRSARSSALSRTTGSFSLWGRFATTRVS